VLRCRRRGTHAARLPHDHGARDGSELTCRAETDVNFIFW
jgi:hypothetical protein